MTHSFDIPRTKLLSTILGRSEPIVLVQAPAGMGKTTLLRQIADAENIDIHSAGSPPLIGSQSRLVLWDIPPGVECHGLPEIYLDGRKRLVLAVRSGRQIPGLHRARAYGRAFIVDWRQLAFSASELSPLLGLRQARKIVETTGGWPVLSALFAKGPPDDEHLNAFLREEVLTGLSVEELMDLEELADKGIPADESLEALAPLLRRDDSGRFRLLPVLEARFPETVAAALVARAGDGDEAAVIADSCLRRGRTTRAIRILQQAGNYDQAQAVYRAAGGFFFIYRYGTTAHDEVLAGFPETFWRQHESLVLGLCLQSLKRGDVGRARQLLHGLVGPVGANPRAMLANPAVHSMHMRAFRHLMMIYEDTQIDEALMKLLFSLLDEMPADAHLERGSFYNAVLEFYMRGRRFSEAEDVAERAYAHYVAADVPILRFYISLHLAIMRLTGGDVVKAARHADAAEAEIRATPFDSPSDARLLALLKACIAFEQGQAGALLHFLNADFDQFSHGEIWPTVFEFALQYGAQALGEQFSPVAAASFLERWRAYQLRSRQFQDMIDILRIVSLQNGNRWQEAAERLSALDFRVDKAFMTNAGPELTRLDGRDQIAAALALVAIFRLRPANARGIGEPVAGHARQSQADRAAAHEPRNLAGLRLQAQPQPDARASAGAEDPRGRRPARSDRAPGRREALPDRAF